MIWSPSASTWGAVLDQRRADAGKAPYVTTPGKSFMLTPLVIAMPKPMAEALGYPATPIGFSDILALAQDPAGWAAKGHPEWGPFRLGKTNPNFSTSGLAADGRAVLRGDGQDERPHARGPRPPRGRGRSSAASSPRSSTTATRRSRS